MDGTARNARLRPLLGVLALALVVAAIWAATALAAGGSSGSSGADSSDGPAASSTQAPNPEDCPERDGSSSSAAADT